MCVKLPRADRIARLPGNKPDPSDSEDHCAHASPHHIEKDECVWLPDGDIILLPRDEAIGFRVYREVLERESGVLKDEIARQLPTAVTTADGRPAICMPDTTHELQTLLSALFMGKEYVPLIHSLLKSSLTRATAITMSPTSPPRFGSSTSPRSSGWATNTKYETS